MGALRRVSVRTESQRWRNAFHRRRQGGHDFASREVLNRAPPQAIKLFHGVLPGRQLRAARMFKLGLPVGAVPMGDQRIRD